MKTFTLLLAVLWSAFAVTAQPCSNAQAFNPPILTMPQTIQQWVPQEPYCFPNICSDFENPFGYIVNFDISPALAGPFMIVTTGHPTTHQTAITVMSMNCDSVLVSKCLNYPIDTTIFENTTSKFSLWYQSTYDTFALVYRGNPTTSPPAPPAPCLTTATIQTSRDVLTYQRFNTYTGQLSEPSETIPQGLSLRSDGVKVLRQGPPFSFFLMFACIAICYLCLKTWHNAKE